MTYTAVGKEVLRDGQHFADCCSDADATMTANALTMHDDMIAIDVDDHPREYVTGTRHSIRQETDEYACSCGARWDCSEGMEHP